jgi:hypothetical protein
MLHIYMLFYKVWHSSPPLLSQTMANRILRVPANSLIPWRSVIFIFFFLWLQWSYQLSCKISDEQMKHASQGVLNLIRKIKTRPLRPHELKTVSQNKKYFEGFER